MLAHLPLTPSTTVDQTLPSRWDGEGLRLYGVICLEAQQGGQQFNFGGQRLSQSF